LIYSVAIKAGLTDAEAQDVVQETIITVAKKINDFKADSARGSFKGWLLNTTRWRIADQFRKRLPVNASVSLRNDETARTATAERIPDPAGFVPDSTWDEEWEQNLRTAALENVKRKVAPEEFQLLTCVFYANARSNRSRRNWAQLGKFISRRRKFPACCGRN
jgi:RNA polymerase sigma-70 factor (ECF subfamily)